MTIPTDRLRELANGATIYGHERNEIATELLACREDLAAERERFNLLSQRCDAAERDRDAARIRGDDLAGRLAVAIVWRRSLARACNDFIEAFDEHGVYDGLFYGSDSWLSALRAEVRSAQPTKSEVIAERDAARAEAEQARRDGQEIASGLHEKLAEVRAELAAVKRQRDELLESLRNRCSAQRADWLKESRGAPSKMIEASCAMAAGSFGTVLEWIEEAQALAAEQREHQAPDGGGCAGDFADQLPKGPAHGRFTDAERSELDALKRKAFEAAKPKPPEVQP